MMMPNRSYSATNSYRYGFNGKENDNEVKGEGNEQDYGMRVYDTRLGRFLSVDPLMKDYPELTPYQFASNTPLWALDLDGLEGLVATGMPLGNSGVSHGMIVSPPAAHNAVQNIGQWWNSPASVQEKKAIAYQVNYHSSGVDLSAQTFDGMTKGQYWFRQIGLSALSYSQSSPGNLKIPSVHQPETPALKSTVKVVEVNEPMTTITKQTNQAHRNSNAGEANTATVYRTQGGQMPNASEERIAVGQKGKVSIIGDNMLYVTIDDKAHQLYFYNKRGGSEKGAGIVSVQIPQNLADEIKKMAIPQAQGKMYPDRPQISDPTKSNSAYGLPKPYIDKLRQLMIQGTGKVQAPTNGVIKN